VEAVLQATVLEQRIRQDATELQTPVAVAVAAWQPDHKQTVEPVVLVSQ
jgi:hypothetical protein